ncbi:MAG: hypothetical protein KF819_29845 [Labilithrix sp.]|nr:hypothetical protein [Labilithrix sp.]
MSRSSAQAARSPRAREPSALVALPHDLAQLLDLTGQRALGELVPLPNPRKASAPFASVVGAARRQSLGRAKLCALLAGAVPFGSTKRGELWLYVLGEEASPSRGMVATIDPAIAAAVRPRAIPSAPRLAFRDASTFALACALDATDAAVASELRAKLPAAGVAELEGMRAALERARGLLELLTSNDAAVRRAAKSLAHRPFASPDPPDGRGKPKGKPRALALGPLVEAFFRAESAEARAVASAQRESPDRVVREAAAVIADALDDSRRPRTALARDLARRRAIALRAARAGAKPSVASSTERAKMTERLVGMVDATRSEADPLATSPAHEEALVALAELGDRSVVPALVARARTGDISAVEMLGALGDPRAVTPLIELLDREPARLRQLETAVVRALTALGDARAEGALRALLARNPMPSWREGIERGVLVREIVTALGTLRDERAGSALLEVLESRSHEYRAILPVAAWALGRIRHVPALATLDRLLASPKEPPTCEAIWAVGEIGGAQTDDEKLRARAAALLEGLAGLEPGAEMVRLTALAKTRGRLEGGRSVELRRALERALWEPAFRREETSRRRVWGLRSLEELAALRAEGENNPFFLGHEAVRHFVTRDDHRVRRAAEETFAAWGVAVPSTRRYYAVVLDALEAQGGLDALHDALRDPLGVFRHNVATHLAERADASSVRPLAEAAARLFAEPPTSAYEYDDAPSHLVAFVRALAKLNRPEGNDVLIGGLRGGNHQVRAVVAENAPDDERFVPELMAMLGDPRSFLRSRAERSLQSLGVREHTSDQPPRLLEV